LPGPRRPGEEGSPVTSDPEPRRVRLSSGEIAYVDEGPRGAPAVLAVHGIPGSLRDFRYLAPRLTDRLRLVRLDLPGFGASDATDNAVRTLVGRTRAVVDLADHLELSSFAVLGHSMGGATALPLAAAHRQRVRLLVLVASVGLSRHRGLGMRPGTFTLFGRALRWPLVSRPLLRIARAQYERRRFPGADRMSAREFALQLRAIGAVDFALLRRAAVSLPPTLVVYADDDPLVEPAIAEELLATIPSARPLRFKEGGHNLQKTRAAEIAGAIRRELAPDGRADAGPDRET
jgi:pimeloyl-ACP methyl ester carboxylesterase